MTKDIVSRLRRYGESWESRKSEVLKGLEIKVNFITRLKNFIFNDTKVEDPPFYCRK